MLCYSPLVGGQNGTPVLDLCHFIYEKNVVQGPRVFTVNSYIELSRSRSATEKMFEIVEQNENMNF